MQNDNDVPMVDRDVSNRDRTTIGRDSFSCNSTIIDCDTFNRSKATIDRDSFNCNKATNNLESSNRNSTILDRGIFDRNSAMMDRDSLNLDSFNLNGLSFDTADEDPLPNFGPGSIYEKLRELQIRAQSKRRAATNLILKGGASAYIDQDDSGNYDPKKELSDLRRKRIKRVRPVELLDGENESPRPNKNSRITKFDGLVTLTFTSRKCLNYLRSITSGTISESGHLPMDIDGNDTSIGTSFELGRRARVVKKVSELQPRDDGLTLDQLTNGHPQRRGCKNCFMTGNDDCTLVDYGHDYPCEACEDAEVDCELIVPPKLKRDCERCNAKRVQCSYRRSQGKGQTSCKACEEEGHGCIAGPLVEATRRMNDILARTTPERQGMTAPKSPSPSPSPVPPRRFVGCNQCRNNGKRCSLKSKQDPGPCSACRKFNQHCQFVIIPPSQLVAYEKEMATDRLTRNTKITKGPVRKPGTPRRARREDGMAESPRTNTHKLYTEHFEKKVARRNKKTNDKDKDTSTTLASSSPTSRPVKDQSSALIPGPDASSLQLVGYTAGNRHIFITTHFCHPIIFNYQLDISSPDPCSWCDDPLFGIHGLAAEGKPPSVEGFYDPQGHGFVEIMGGFAERGAKQTKMCVKCTFARIEMLSCSFHTVKKLTAEENDGWVYDWKKFNESATKWLEKDIEGAKYFLDTKWCDICPNFASYKCASPTEDAIEHQGCGLLLCTDCAELVEKLIKGGIQNGRKQLDTLVREVEAQKWQFESGIRADAGFLTSSGELWDRVWKGFGTGTNTDGDDGKKTVTKGSLAYGPTRLSLKGTEYTTQGARLEKKATDTLQKDEQLRIDVELLSPLLDRKGKGKDMNYFESMEEYQSRIEKQRIENQRRTALSRLLMDSDDDQGDEKHTALHVSEDVHETAGNQREFGNHSGTRDITLDGRAKPRREQVAMPFGCSFIDLTED